MSFNRVLTPFATCPSAQTITWTFRLLLPTPLINQLIQTEHLGSTIEHMLLDAVLGDEPEDVHPPRQSNTMSSAHGLQISLWIPMV